MQLGIGSRGTGNAHAGSTCLQLMVSSKERGMACGLCDVVSMVGQMQLLHGMKAACLELLIQMLGTIFCLHTSPAQSIAAVLVWHSAAAMQPPAVQVRHCNSSLLCGTAAAAADR